MRTAALDSLDEAAPWWRRDVPFPRFWPAFPLLLVGSIAATLLGSSIWAPLGALAYCFGWLGGLALLWGPGGLARPAPEPAVAWRWAISAGAAAMVPFVVFWLLT